jgi:hypothetical protein
MVRGNIYFDGTRAVEDHGGHDRAMLGEGVRRRARIAMLLGTGRILRPVQCLCLRACEAEYEIRREAIGIALDLLVEALGGDAIEGSEFGIQQCAMTTQDEDRAGNVLGRDQSFNTCHGAVSVWPD